MTNDASEAAGSSHVSTSIDSAGVCAAWLDWIILAVPGVRRGLVMTDAGAGVLEVQAVKPSGSAIQDLVAVVNAHKGIARMNAILLADGHLLIQPLTLAGRSLGIVGLHFAGPASAADKHELVARAALWLTDLVGIRVRATDAQSVRRAKLLLDLQAMILAQERFSSAASAFATGLAEQFDASLAHIGWVRASVMRVEARSHAAWHEERAGLINLAAQAMNEAYDQRRTVHWHAAHGSASDLERQGHAAYAREARAGVVLSVPLFHRGEVLGAVMLERETQFSPDEIAALETLGMMLAPILALIRSADASLVTIVRERATRAARALVDSSNPGWKLTAALLALAVLLAALVPVSFRVAAPAVVEGEVQRAAVAPFQGFIREARARAGDVVKSGQILALLEDKDLQLERVRWAAELEIAERREREAMAAAKRVDARLAAAQADQSRALLDLAEEKLRRVQIVAPFDGVIVRGDLSQQIGSPVEQGKVLFELAPLASWRVILKVDVRDIAYVEASQEGRLVLTGLPGENHAFTIRRVTSVASADEGRNYFRVEADLTERTARLRPGMEGVAKVMTGDASALWVWTRRLIDWLRMAIWEWSP